MSEMVERVARAVYEVAPIGVRLWEDAPGATRDHWCRVARAAIAAMREPTEKMVMAGGVQLLNRGEYEPTAADGANDIWCAMIDVELK